jgi:HD-like signal output (HDOD) protein
MIADLSMSGSALTPIDVVREVKHLPSAPKVLPRLKQLLSDGNSTIHEIVMLVRLDAGIAARVLQMANSVYYCKGVRCFTVDEAITRVGYDNIYELVAYAVASQVLVRPLITYGIEADELWKRSVTSALAAEILAARLGEDRNLAYTVGLLHGVGMVAIDEWALRNVPSVIFRNEGFPKETSESERAVLGFSQAEVSAALLRHWAFPAAMCDPVRWQFAPRASVSNVRLACILHLAKWLRAVMAADISTGLPPAPHPGILEPVGLTATALTEMVVEVGDALEEVSSLLSAPTAVVVKAGKHRFPIGA